MPTTKEIKDQFDSDLVYIVNSLSYPLARVCLNFNEFLEIKRILNKYGFPFRFDNINYRNFIADEETLLAIFHVLDENKDNIQHKIHELVSTSEQLSTAEPSKNRDATSELDQHLRDLSYLSIKASELANALTFLKSTSTTNILRHSFILLMAIFDAAVFDLSTHFSIPLKGNLQLKAAIEEIKRRRIIYRDANQNWKFEELVEHILRRNVHLHERGYAHERYTKGVDKLNSINPKLVAGNYAVIDRAYFHKARKRCEEAVDQIYAFITNEQT